MKCNQAHSCGIFILIILFTFNLLAGDKAGNGGDPNEQKFKEIALNFRQWIESGNADRINLPSHISLERYKKSMLSALMNYTVSFTSKKVFVSGVEKTCKNNTDSDNKKHILCNNERFDTYYSSNINEIYLIIHHEFAGIAGFEVSNGRDSDYSISNQISGFLQKEVVKRLPVVKHNSLNEFISCKDPYTGSFDSKSENGWFIFTSKAYGYITTHPLAEKLGLQLNQPITQLEFRIPSSQCSWIQELAQLSCFSTSTLLIFQTEKGATLPVNASRITVSTGIMGVGVSSSQMIQLEIDVDRFVRITQTYSTMRILDDWILCGRKVR